MFQVYGTFPPGSRNSKEKRMTREGDREEQRLISRLRAGSEEAIAAIYRRCSGPVYRFALHMTGKASLAEDITHETFLELLSNNRSFDPGKGALLGWLLGVARNKTRRAMREVFGSEPMEESEAQELAVGEDILSEFTRQERIASLRQAIATLPPHLREVVLLCEMQELGYSEAAEIIKCPVGTVRSRLHRAKSMLISKLNARCPA
jgi:RNA polymerase sigma-70 factor, ECF subfamily